MRTKLTQALSLFLLLAGLVGFVSYYPTHVKAQCASCNENECGGACGSRRCIYDDSEDLGCYVCGPVCNTPTPTREAAPPTPTPVPPPSDGSPTPTSTGGSGGSGSPAPTSNPGCNYTEPSAVYFGSCDGTTANCDSSSSTISCENGQCKYSGNLNPCPNASCPAYWVPGGWGCGNNNNRDLSDLEVYINPDNVTDPNDPDRFDVSMGVSGGGGIRYKDGGTCRQKIHFSIGPNPNNLFWARGCTYIYSNGGKVWCLSDQDGTNANNNRGAVWDNLAWEYRGGPICVQATLFWHSDWGAVNCDGVGNPSFLTTCVYPACKILSLDVSTPDMCVNDSSTTAIPYTLTWTAENQTSADHLTAYWIDDSNGTTTYVPDGFSPANPLSVNTTTTSINLPPKNGGYGFYLCCSGGSKSGDYNCAYAGSSDNWIYADSGAPEPPTFASDSPNYSAADNTVTFHWSWEGDHANCSSGICSDHEGPVNYCINGQPGGSYSPMCTNCYAPYYWQVVVDGTGNTLQNNNNAQSSVTQSCSGHEGQTLRLDVRSKDARGNASSFVSQSYVCPTATPTPTLPNPTPTSIWVTPTPTPASVHCSAASVRDSTGQPVTQVVGSVGDSYSLTYTLDDYSTDWTPGIRYQFNELTGGSASTFCSSGTNSCTLTGTIGAGQDSVWFFANLKKDLDPDGDGVYDTYRCRWNGTWSNPPGAPPNTTGGCVNTCELKIPFVTPTPTATPTPTPQSCFNGSECPGGICTSGICGTPTPTLVPKQPTPPPPTLVTV